MKWTCKDSEGKGCGKTHRSLQAAFECCQKHRAQQKRNPVHPCGRPVAECDREHLELLRRKAQFGL
jgi:hypothetical protein